MTPKFKHYASQFSTHDRNGIKLGGLTNVEIVDLQGAEHPDPASHRDTLLTVTATLKVKATVGLIKGGSVWQCSVCDGKAPSPDDDALWYILQNHDGGRLVFPGPEAIHSSPERDSYPVTGWTELAGGGLVCVECRAELDEVMEAIRAKRRGR